MGKGRKQHLEVLAATMPLKDEVNLKSHTQRLRSHGLGLTGGESLELLAALGKLLAQYSPRTTVRTARYVKDVCELGKETADHLGLGE